MHLCDSVSVVGNDLGVVDDVCVSVDVYVRAERARLTKARTLDFNGWFPNGA